MVLTILQKCIVDWYHIYLLHLGPERTEATISQHCHWPKLRDNIRTHIKVCSICQKNKKQNLKCGKLPTKEVEAIPWDRILVDLIGPYKIRREGHYNPLIIKSLNYYRPGNPVV